MSRYRILSLLVIAGALLSSARLSAQPIPQTGDFEICFSSSGADFSFLVCEAGGIAPLPNGRFAVATYGLIDFRDPDRWSSSTHVEIFNAAGRSQRTLGLSSGGFVNPNLVRSTAARDGSGGFVAAWQVSDQSPDIQVQWFRPNGTAKQPDPVTANNPQDGLCNSPPAIATNQTGQTVVAWQAARNCLPATSIGVRAFGADRQKASPVVRIRPRVAGNSLQSPQVWMGADGKFFVAWIEVGATPETAVLRGRLFGSRGRPLGAPVDFADEGTPATFAILPDGQVLVVWRLQSPPTGREPFRMQRYTAAGVPSGRPRELRLPRPAFPFRIASDQHGNLALLSSEADRPRVRLFERNLVPQGAPFDIGPAGTFPEEVAFLDTGSLLTIRLEEGRFRNFFLVGRIWKVDQDGDR